MLLMKGITKLDSLGTPTRTRCMNYLTKMWEFPQWNKQMSKLEGDEIMDSAPRSINYKHWFLSNITLR